MIAENSVNRRVFKINTRLRETENKLYLQPLQAVFQIFVIVVSGEILNLFLENLRILQSLA